MLHLLTKSNAVNAGMSEYRLPLNLILGDASAKRTDPRQIITSKNIAPTDKPADTSVKRLFPMSV